MGTKRIVEFLDNYIMCCSGLLLVGMLLYGLALSLPNDNITFSKTNPADIGDSLIDYQTAQGAGVTFIAYKNKSLRADYHADSNEFFR